MLADEKKVILGSNSPRRKELLAGLGLEFIVDVGNSFVETYSPDTPHEQIPVIMAEGKSQGFHRPLADNEILITADTMVLCGTEVMGKPHSREDAHRMLRLLSGRQHRVITAVCIRSNMKTITFSDETLVYFNELSDNEIYNYIDKYSPYDKAGAYGAQDWIGYAGIKRLEGSYFNVMGLPVHKVWAALKEFGVVDIK